MSVTDHEKPATDGDEAPLTVPPEWNGDLHEQFEWQVSNEFRTDPQDPVRVCSFESAKKSVEFVLSYLPSGVAGHGQIVQTYFLAPQIRRLVWECRRDKDGFWHRTDHRGTS